MTTRPMVVTWLLLAGATPAFAQYCITNTSDPNYDHCRQQEEQWRRDEAERQQKASEEQRQRDVEDAEHQRRSAPQTAGQSSQQAQNDAALQALRARLLASPALPPDRNPLLGRWRVATGGAQRGGDDLSQLLGMLSNPGAAMCEVVFGGGIVEFKPGSWASIDSAGDDSLGPVQYRTHDEQVFALPDQGLPLLGFDIVDRSTIREFRLQDCVLERVGAPPVDSAAQVTTGPPATPAAGPAAVRFKSVKDQLGVDTVANVERDIRARGGSPGTLRAGSQGVATLSTPSGDYSDAGPYVSAVNYDFDGTGSAARLVAVTVVHSFGVYGDAYKELVDARKAALAKDFGALQVKSATESSGAAGGYVLTLFENPDTGYFYEKYTLAR